MSDALQLISWIMNQVTEIVTVREPAEPVTVEQIQDVVEISLMRREHFHVARRYILYRTEHARMRAIRGEASRLDSLDDRRQQEHRLFVEIEAGVRVPFDVQRLKRRPDRNESIRGSR